jgi:hypothetical protein
VSLARLRWGVGIGCALALIAVTGAGATAVVEVNDLILRADGGFQPRTLPRHRFAPIEFQGHFDVAAKGGGRPATLNQVTVEFDRDGRLSVAGLPTCPRERIAEASTEEARQACHGAIVGTGSIEALVSLASGPVPASSPLTIFNGEPLEGHPTVILHARTTTPGIQTFAIVVPIERRRGEFRYRATIDLPPIAAGLGAITHVDAKIGRRFSAGGKRRSYVSAHCSDGILRTRGFFSFEDGTIIDGSVEKFCRAQ